MTSENLENSDDTLPKNVEKEHIKVEKKKKKKKKKNRCHNCKKNVGLMGFKCKCGLLFCTTHLHPECHNCTFDHKSCARDNLSKNLTKIAAAKIEVI